MSTLKRYISLLLVLGILLGVLAPAVQAAPVEETATVNTDNVTIEGTNGFGDLLAREITENQQETETENEDYPGGYTVTDLEIVDNVATVTYDSMEEATLMVALHTEDGMQLLTSATVTVTPDATEATVAFEGEMPEYFMASAYLLDQYDYSPLCASYDTPMYTREMQELLASTVDDYDPERVLNLDDDETTNFAVYADSTIIIEPVEGKNTVASIDDESAVYVIKNADEQITSLKIGDVFVYSYDENELMIVKIADIDVDGTTVTITGAELEISEAFSAVKIDGIGENEDILVDDSTAGEGISYVGLVEDEGIYAPNAAEGGDTTTLKHKFEIKIDSKASNDHTSASLAVSGSLDLALEVSVKYYISASQKYVEFKLSPRLSFTLSVKESLTLYKELGYLAVSPVPGVYVGFEPELQLKFDGKTEFKATLKSVIGFKYDKASGVQNISKTPDLDVRINVEGEIFLGIDFCPQVAIVSDNLSEIEVNMLVGFELEAKTSGKAFEAYKKDATEYHECQECLDIEARAKAKIGGTLKFLDQDWLSVSITIGEWTHKLGQMYYSLDNEEFGKGKCPNRIFRVTVQVKDRDQNPLPDQAVTVSTSHEALTTDENGLVVFYSPEAEIRVRAEKDEYFDAAWVTVDKAQKIILTLAYKLNGGGNDGRDDSEPGNPFEGIDFGGVADRGNGNETKSGTCGENVYWTLYDTGLLVISGTGEMTNWEYRSNSPWYAYREQIKKVIVENGVTTIGDRAFYDCDSLSSVVIPDSVTTIGGSAFYACNSLTSVVIPDSVTFIGDRVFYKCNSLSRVVIGNSVATIRKYAFYDCDSLSSVMIPDSVTTIANSAFSHCDKLKGIYVDVQNENYASDDRGVLFDKRKTSLIQAPGAISSSYSIPNTVTAIGNSAFSDCDSLSSVMIPDSVTTIGNSAFSHCDSLASVVIPDSITTIDRGTFFYCVSLSSVVIPDSVTTIGVDAFTHCDSLSSVVIGNSVATISISSFGLCARPSNILCVTFRGDAPSIGEDAFEYTDATCYYPANNPTWTSEVMQNYGGTITWVPYTPTDSNTIIGEPTPMSVLEPSIQPQAVFSGDYYTKVTDDITIKTAVFSGLVPGEEYVMLALVSMEADELLAADNLLAIDQGVAAEDGTLSFRYIQRTPCDLSYVFVCGASNKNLNDAEITFPEMIADGELQVVDPTVVYDGKTLTEGTDYVITGTVDYTEEGEYTCYIRGIYNYAGLVECTYTVIEHEHSFTDYVSDGNATCTEDGTKTAKCDHCDVTDTIPDVGSALGHDMGSWETTVPATCTEKGEERRNCSRCGHGESRVIEAVGHRWDKGVVTKEPTEDIEGERLFTCTACGATKTESIPVIGHEHSYEAIVTAPTCTEQGYTTYTCKCGESYTADYVVALGHSFGEWVVITEPTTTEDGLEERSCSRCGHTEQRTVSKLENPFTDVAPGSFYYDPVMWAIENGITNGTSATTFGPNDQCMRAHVVTFLWRAMGCPEPTQTDNPFVDVKPSDFYYKPVLWALENGITSGIDATHFGPTAYCNRAQVVTFLYRTVGSPAVDASQNPFTDVPAGQWFTAPVLWAVENGITNGLSATTFGPNTICNRAQIVTFLYRAFVD